MLNRSKRFIDKAVSFPHQLPKVKPNQILVVPINNKLTECQPFVSSSQIPQWWKEQNKAGQGIRRCYGTLDYVSLGITLPLWTNVYVRPSADRTDFEIKLDHLAYSPERFNVEGFPAQSVTESCPFSAHRQIKGGFPKLVTPWLYKTAPGYSSLIMPMSLEPNPYYDVMPGVVHTDYYHHINIVLLIKTDQEFMIPIGTPMYQIIPFKRSDKTKEIVFGNESMFHHYAGRGTGDAYLSNEPRKNIYRRIQAQIDSQSEAEHQTLLGKFKKKR